MNRTIVIIALLILINLTKSQLFKLNQYHNDNKNEINYNAKTQIPSEIHNFDAVTRYHSQEDSSVTESVFHKV